jgi:hypothetical protein
MATTTGIRGHLSFALGGSTPVGDKDVSTMDTYLAAAGSFGTANRDSDKWWTQPFTAATLAVNEFAEMLPQELGATLFTRGGYKSGVFLAGSASMEIRLAKYFGKVLQSMGGLGIPSAITARAADATVTSAANSGAALASASTTTLTLTTAASPTFVPGDIVRIEKTSGTPAYEDVLIIKDLDSAAHLSYKVARGYNNTVPATSKTAGYVKYAGNDTSYFFGPTPNNEQAVPLVHARRYVPDSSGGSGYTEYGLDGKAISLSLALPQMGAAKAELGVVFRRPFGKDTEHFGYCSTDGVTTASGISGMSDTPLSLALSCTSNISLPQLGIYGPSTGGFMGAQVQLVNGAIPPQDGMIVGSYYPEDFTILSRGGTVRMAYKWKDEALYDAVVYGGNLGDWQPQIKYSDVVLSLRAANNATSFPYTLDLVFPNVALTMSAPQLVAGKFVMTEVTGAITYDSVSGYPWFAVLRNGATAYDGLS